MALTLHTGSVGIGHLFPPHSNWGLGPVAIRRRVPLTAPSTALSHWSLRESTRPPWEYKSSSSVSVSSSVGSQGSLDRVAESGWVALVQPAACVVMPPLVTPPIKSVEVVLPLFLPAVPASWVAAEAAVCLTGVAELGVDVAGPSLPSVLLSLPWRRYFNQISVSQ